MSIADIKQRLKADNLQTIKATLRNWPMLHFSEHSERIVQEGFRFGAHLNAIHFTDNSERQTSSDKGIYFAFNTLEYCFEQDTPDFMAGINSGLQGMYSNKAVLFLGDGVYTQHYDEFNQILFENDNTQKNTFLLLECIGNEPDEEESFFYDEAILDFWIAKDCQGNLITEGDALSLNECVEQATHYLLSHYKADHKAYKEFELMFSNLDAPKRPETNRKSKPN